MPSKIKMIISNGYSMPKSTSASSINYANLAVAPTVNTVIPSTLNSSMIGRIHSIKPGCGSCGRK